LKGKYELENEIKILTQKNIELNEINKKKEYTLKNFDPSKYVGKSVVYLLHIEKNIYKYGCSYNFFQRAKDHRNKRDWTKYLEVFDCFLSENAREVELKFKRYLIANKLLTTYMDKNNCTHTEIFETDNDISIYIDIIKKYVEEVHNKCKKKYIEYFKPESNNDRLSILENKIENLIGFMNNNKLIINNSEITEEENNDIIEEEENNEIIEENNDIIEEDNDIIEEDNDIIEEDNDIIEEENDIIEEDNDIIEEEKNNEIIEEEDDNEIIKKCVKCKKEKPETEEFFRLKKNKNIYTNYCIICLDKDKERCNKKRETRNEYNKKYLEKQKEIIKNSEIPLQKCCECSKILELNDENFSKNNDDIYKKTCNSCVDIINKNREEINKKHREFCAKTDYDKKMYEKHKDKKLEQKKTTYINNIDEYKQKNQEYYKINREKILEQKKNTYNKDLNKIS
jgi:hypothetical protein